MKLLENYQKFSVTDNGSFCKDENKYQVVNQIVKWIKEIKNKKIKIDEMNISEILTINGIRFTLDDGSWGLIRASSNKPSLVVVVETLLQKKRKKEYFRFYR